MVKYTESSRELVTTRLISDSLYLHVISEPTVETPVLLVDASEVVKSARVYRLRRVPDFPEQQECGCLLQLGWFFTRAIEKETTELSTERRDANVRAFIEPQGTVEYMSYSAQGRQKLDLREVSDKLSTDHDMRFILLVSSGTAATASCSVLVSKEIARAVVQQVRLEAARRKQARAQAEREVIEAAQVLIVVKVRCQQLEYELEYETLECPR